MTRIIQDDVNEPQYTKIRNWTVSDLREWILDEKTTGADIRRLSRGLTSEMVAAVAKLMSNLDLIYAAQKIRITAHCNTTIGLPGTLSCRLQPNHTTDDPDGILASTLEGLTFGAGDAVIGLNPVTDSAQRVKEVLERFREVKERWNIPTQTCVLAHVTTQMARPWRPAPRLTSSSSPLPAAKRATRPLASPPKPWRRPGPWLCPGARRRDPTSCILKPARARSCPPKRTLAQTR